MGRFLFMLGWIMLVLLLIDSAMHDPDVQPIVDRQLKYAETGFRSVLNWFGADEAESHPGKDSPGAGTRDSPASRWYWSTMLVMVVAAIRLSKSVAWRYRVAAVSAPSCWSPRAMGLGS